jgi:CubicO group peptidase (beta-lactamase class C family)
MKLRAVAVLSLVLLARPLLAEQAAAVAPKIPVSAARAGFTPEQARELRARYSYEEVISAGDVSLFHFLNLGIWLPTAPVVRQGSFVPLATATDPRVGETRVSAGGTKLGDYLVSPTSRAQGMVVVHRGRIVFEDYPGMRPFDYHVWMSTAKTTTSLVVRLLAEAGKIDVARPIESYVPALRGTEWAGTSVLDVLDMASGMDIVETQANREKPRSAITRYNLAASGEPNADGRKEELFEVVRTAKRLRPAGESFDYSSMNTTVLVRLAEAVENKRWHEIFQERVWAKMTAEGDMPVAYAPDGTALPHGLVASSLRDMALYGLLYTPSWDKAARERVVSAAYVREIQTGGRKGIFMKGEIGAAIQKVHFPNDPPTANHWQWDGVWDDGDFFKGGVFGQGLYVSPARDLVVAWFSTAMSNDLTQYARQIALETPPAR